MTIVEGKIIDYEQAKSVGQNQNWAQNITIEDKQGRTLTGEILVKEKNIVTGKGNEYIKWEVTQSDYGPKFKRYRETTWQGSGGGGQRSGQQGGGKREGNNVDRSVAMSYAKDLVVAGKIDITIMFATAEEMLNWVEGKPAPQQKALIGPDVGEAYAQPNPEYSENPAEPEGEIPF